MSDIISRLRLAYVATDIEILGEAADEIERLNDIIDPIIQARSMSQKEFDKRRKQYERLFKDIRRKVVQEAKSRGGFNSDYRGLDLDMGRGDGR
jgi:hypothetical protein